MSLQLFPGVADTSIPTFNAETNAAFTGAYAEYDVKIGAIIGSKGRVRTSVTRIGVKGNDQSDCDNSAAEIAVELAKASKGVLMGLVKYLGKYRNDELPEVVASGQTVYGVVMLTNGRTSDEDVSPEPFKLINTNVFVPFADEEKFIALLGKFRAKQITLGASRFTDSNKNSLSIAQTINVRGMKMLDINSAKSFGLVLNDSAIGAGDGIISEGL